MAKTNRILIVLLILLVVGVWGLLLRPFFTDYFPLAQAQVHKQYAIVAIDKEGKLAIGGDGTIGLNATGLQWAVDEVPRKGWRIHSVACPQAGGYVVVVEK